MNHKTSNITSKDAEVLFILSDSSRPLSTREIAELREDDDAEELENVRYFLRKLQKRGYVYVISNVNGLTKEYELSVSGRKLIEAIKLGTVKPRGSFRTPMSSIGTCEMCGKENCNRTQNRINGEMKKLCRDCLINDKPMTLEEYIDGRQHSSLNEFSMFPVHKRTYFQPKESNHESKATV